MPDCLLLQLKPQNSLTEAAGCGMLDMATHGMSDASSRAGTSMHIQLHFHVHSDESRGECGCMLHLPDMQTETAAAAHLDAVADAEHGFQICDAIMRDL